MVDPVAVNQVGLEVSAVVQAAASLLAAPAAVLAVSSLVAALASEADSQALHVRLTIASIPNAADIAQHVQAAAVDFRRRTSLPHHSNEHGLTSLPACGDPWCGGLPPPPPGLPAWPINGFPQGSLLNNGGLQQFAGDCSAQQQALSCCNGDDNSGGLLGGMSPSC